MRLLTAALDHCRDAKGQAMDPPEERLRGGAILAALTATASTTGHAGGECRSRRVREELGASLRSAAPAPSVDVQRLRRPRPGARMSIGGSSR